MHLGGNRRWVPLTNAINHNLCESSAGIFVHLEKQAGFHLITTILAIAKKQIQFSDPGIDDFYLIAAIAAIG